jgi:enoyl-CoA hydratase/carnithine racemase
MSDLRIHDQHAMVRVLTLARPAKRNALSRDLIAGLRAALLAAEAEGIRAVVLAAEGKGFSAGADFADLRGDASDLDYDDAMSELTGLLEDSPMISVAAIHGACIGAGLDLALACDFRLASPEAVFALPAVEMGILYNPARLARVLPMLTHGAATRLLLLADRLGAAEAQAAGIVTHLMSEGEAPEVAAVALAIRAASLPPQAQATARAFVDAFHGSDFNQAEWQARRMALLASDERREALRRARGESK